MKIDGAGRARESLFTVKTVNCKVKFSTSVFTKVDICANPCGTRYSFKCVASQFLDRFSHNNFLLR